MACDLLVLDTSRFMRYPFFGCKAHVKLLGRAGEMLSMSSELCALCALLFPRFCEFRVCCLKRHSETEV